MARQVKCPNCETKTPLRDVPVLDSVEFLAEYTDGSMVTVPSTPTVTAVACPHCGTSVFLPETVDVSAVPRTWLPVREPEALAQVLEALNCKPGRVELQWHIACIQTMNQNCRLTHMSSKTEQPPEWTYLNKWVANFANLEFANDASDVAEAYRRIGKFEECLRSLEKGTIVDRPRAKKIQSLALDHRTELERL